MPVVGDFVVIENREITIGDNGNAINPYEKSFNTGGRRTQEGAYVSLMVKGLRGNSSDAQVRINNRVIGSIEKTSDGGEDEWQTQMLAFDGNLLESGNNRITIFGAPFSGGNLNDFVIKSLICHFHQSA